MHGPNLSSNGAVSNNIGNSQSRIKVNLSQHEEDAMGMTGMEEEPHVIAPKPTLIDDRQQVET